MVNVASAWRNRIVGLTHDPPDQLLANPMNFRRHPGEQREAVAGLLDEVGWVTAVVVNDRTGHLIDGHLRVEEALTAEEPTVPVLHVDLSEAEEREILAALDRTTTMAQIDAVALDALMREVTSSESAVQQMLSTMAADNGLTWGEGGKIRPESGAASNTAPITIPEQFSVLIECDDEAMQAELLARLSEEGYRCRALIS